MFLVESSREVLVVKVGSAMRFARRNCASCELEGRIYAIGGPEL
jgi:hypothetical protein